MVALVVPLGCTIPANPDISGIGVRTAIYAQNLICIISALTDTTNLILAFAILISSIVQARTLGMTSYHANIVLSLSWMNNTNAFVYFILYIHHKIGLPEAEGGVAATGRAWVRHVKDNCPFTLSGLKGHDTEAGNAPNNRANKDRKGLGAKILVKRFVLVLGSLHLTLMAALGIWLWSDLQLELFGAGNRNPSDFKSANECALDRAAIAILGQGVPLGSPTLRVASIVIYSLFLIPGINLIGPMILFLVAYFGCCRAPVAKRWDVLPAYIGLGILLVVNLVFIIDIELTLDSNRGLPSEDEADWGFGQILAILLLLLPLRDLVEAMLARRLKQRQVELDEDLQEAIETQSFDRVRRVIERGSSFPSPNSQDQHSRFWDLVAANDALDYFNSLRRTRMTTTEKALESDLHLAIEAKDDSRVTTLYSQGADLLAGVLQLSMQQVPSSGQHVNRQGPDGRTALMNASRADDELIARALLTNPLIDANLQDASGRTALLTAAENDRTAIVKMLLEHDDIPLNATDYSGRTALIAAAEHGREAIVKMLLERDEIRHDAADNNGCTALTMALRKGRGSITKMLLDQANIHLDAADSQLALSWALQGGHEGTVKMLLDRPDIRTNAQRP
ncbi:ankyrin repeat-containing domain protein [Coprinopsis sp. MPI-PUGE-AT-0042]|nr:ankyrin repeat-containing domain protein [Coprinopsis sp. MPI-PUGE-AT-0042]